MTLASVPFECLRSAPWLAASTDRTTSLSMAALGPRGTNHKLVAVPLSTRTNSRLANRPDVLHRPVRTTAPNRKDLTTEVIAGAKTQRDKGFPGGVLSTPNPIGNEVPRSALNSFPWLSVLATLAALPVHRSYRRWARQLLHNQG